MLSFALCQCSMVSGQSIAFADNPIANSTHFNDSSYTTHHRRHCITTHIGEGIMIGGGVIIVAGVGDALFTKDNGDLTGALFIVGGNFLAGIGAIVFASGRLYEKTHKARFSMISKGDQIGLAYNF